MNALMKDVNEGSDLWDDLPDAELPPSDRSDQELAINASSTVVLCCNRATVKKVVHFALSTAAFGTTAYFGINELLGSGNIVILSLCGLFNGASVSSIAHSVIAPEYRKKISELVSAWSYETVLALSQVYLNVVPADQMQVYAVPFVWGLGVFAGKDILSLASMQQPDLPLPAVPAKESELLRTIGFTTKNYSKASKVRLTGAATAAIGLSVLNFVIKDQYASAGDFGKIGIYQDLIALFSGSVLGDLIARYADDKKEELELKHVNALIKRNETPRALKVMRVAKNIIVIVTPLSIGALLAAPTAPNSGGDFATKAGVGTLYGFQMLLAKRNFEDPGSYLHAVSKAPKQLGQAVVTTCSKVKEVSKKYLPSICFFGALTGYMGWAAATNIARVDYAIVVLLLTTFASFVATDRVAVNYRPERNKRINNELAFRLIYSSIALSIFFQYLTTKLDIGDRNLDDDSTSLYILSLVTWAFWGLVVGNNRAVNIQPKVRGALPVTPPITMQVLSKTFVNTFQRSGNS